MINYIRQIFQEYNCCEYLCDPVRYIVCFLLFLVFFFHMNLAYASNIYIAIHIYALSRDI